MTLYDFSCGYYFQNHQEILVMVDYFKKLKQITQKEINETTGIPKSNFLRAQHKEFDGYDEIVAKMAEYFQIPTILNPSIITEFDELFSLFYTCVCFSKVEEAKTYYDIIVSKADLYKNSILWVPYHLMELIYYVTEVNYTNVVNYVKLDESVEFLKNFVDRMSSEHRFLYYEYMTCYWAFKKDKEQVVHYARLTIYLGTNYHELEPNANYHVSFSYSLIGDFINALIYANKALPKLEEQLNYNKAVFCRINIATLYKKLGNIDEAKRLLKKNLIYMTFYNVDRLIRATHLNYADCLFSEKNYKEAIKHYLIIVNDIIKREDYESIMITYCLYQAEDKKAASAYVNKLIGLNEKHAFSSEYLSLILFFRAYFEAHSYPEIEKAFRAAEADMPGYQLRGSFIQDLAKTLFEEYGQKKSTRLLKNPQGDGDIFA